MTNLALILSDKTIFIDQHPRMRLDETESAEEVATDYPLELESTSPRAVLFISPPVSTGRDFNGDGLEAA